MLCCAGSGEGSAGSDRTSGRSQVRTLRRTGDARRCQRCRGSLQKAPKCCSTKCSAAEACLQLKGPHCEEEQVLVRHLLNDLADAGLVVAQLSPAARRGRDATTRHSSYIAVSIPVHSFEGHLCPKIRSCQRSAWTMGLQTGHRTSSDTGTPAGPALFPEAQARGRRRYVWDQAGPSGDGYAVVDLRRSHSSEARLLRRARGVDGRGHLQAPPGESRQARRRSESQSKVEAPRDPARPHQPVTGSVDLLTQDGTEGN